jgi:hypothetical protein
VKKKTQTVRTKVLGVCNTSLFLHSYCLFKMFNRMNDFGHYSSMVLVPDILVACAATPKDMGMLPPPFLVLILASSS